MASKPTIQLKPASLCQLLLGTNPICCKLSSLLSRVETRSTTSFQLITKRCRPSIKRSQLEMTPSGSMAPIRKGNPVSYVQIGNNYLTLSANITDTRPLENGTGTDYQPVGAATVTISIDNFGSHVVAVHIILYAGMALGGVGILAPFVTGALQAYRFYTSNLAKPAAIYVDNDGLQPPDAASEDGAVIDGEAAADAQITDISPYLPTSVRSAPVRLLALSEAQF